MRERKWAFQKVPCMSDEKILIHQATRSCLRPTMRNMDMFVMWIKLSLFKYQHNYDCLCG